MGCHPNRGNSCFSIIQTIEGFSTREPQDQFHIAGRVTQMDWMRKKLNSWLKCSTHLWRAFSHPDIRLQLPLWSVAGGGCSFSDEKSVNLKSPTATAVSMRSAISPQYRLRSFFAERVASRQRLSSLFSVEQHGKPRWLLPFPQG